MKLPFSLHKQGTVLVSGQEKPILRNMMTVDPVSPKTLGANFHEQSIPPNTLTIDFTPSISGVRLLNAGRDHWVNIALKGNSRRVARHAVETVNIQSRFQLLLKKLQH